MLIDILNSQHKTILNSKEIKKAYLKNIKDSKNQNHITTEKYYEQVENQSQSPSWMFKSAE